MAATLANLKLGPKIPELEFAFVGYISDGPNSNRRPSNVMRTLARNPNGRGCRRAHPLQRDCLKLTETVMAAKKRTTHRSSAGKKLYAERDKSGKFEDVQSYSRAHGSDVKRISKAETAARKKAGSPARKATKK